MNERKLNGLNHTVQKFFSNHILVFLLILPFMMPAFLNENRFGEIIDYFKVAVGIVVVCLFLFQRKISAGIITIAVFYLSFVVTSIIKSGNIIGSIILFSNVIVFSIIIDCGINNDLKVLLDVITFNMFILWTGEFVCLFLYPNGIYRDTYNYRPYGFINIDNRLAPLVIFSFLVLIYNITIKERMKISVLCLIELFASAFITWSATCIVVVLILLLYLIFFYKRKTEKLLDIKILISVVVVLFFAIIVFRIQEIFSFFIENFLGKSITLTGRTEIWDTAFYQIKQTPIWGRGLFAEHGWIYWNNKMYHSHNLFLEILLIGGIFSMILFIIMMFANFSKIDLKRNSNVASLINICLFAMGICSLTETYLTNVYFSVLFVISNDFIVLTETLENKKKNKNQEMNNNVIL